MDNTKVFYSFTVIETRLTGAEENIEGKFYRIIDHRCHCGCFSICENKTYLNVVIMLGISTFHCISGLQATDVNHDARISALEETGGGSQNGK